jgi:tetratricopeptide (TPR) repeat protein
MAPTTPQAPTKPAAAKASKPSAPKPSKHSAAAKPAAIDPAVKRTLREARASFREGFQAVVDGKVSAAAYLGLTPADAKHLIGFAVHMAEKDDLDTAEASAEVAVEADPKSYDAWCVLGSVRARKKEAGKALEAYAKAAAIDAKNPRLWCDVGEIKLSLFDYDGAAKALEMALNLDPKAATPGGARAQALIAKTYAKVAKGGK